MMKSVASKQAANSAVIVRLDRTIQYAAAFALKPRFLHLLDTRLRGYDDHRGSDV
jgi:hypothetical protein